MVNNFLITRRVLLHPSKALSNKWADVTKIKKNLCKNVVKLIIMRHIYISQGKLKMALSINIMRRFWIQVYHASGLSRLPDILVANLIKIFIEY